MGTPTRYFVDPAGGNDGTGDGSIGTPWQTVQHALDTITQDAVDGDQINIKAGTDDVLAAALDFSTYGTPTINAPLVLRGYTAAASDGGIGGLDGDGSFSIISSATLDYIYLLDLHLHNTGANNIITLDDNCLLYNCELDNTTAEGLDLDDSCLVLFCHVHNIATEGVQINGKGSAVLFCHFENGGAEFTHAIDLNASHQIAAFNTFDLAGASGGIQISTYAYGPQGIATVMFNSIYSNAGTGDGIDDDSRDSLIFGNIIEGFSGSGEEGVNSNSLRKLLYGHNALFNNETHVSGMTSVLVDLDNNDELAASPFVDAANADFRIIPMTGVHGDGWPVDWVELALANYLDKGALQRKESMRRPRPQRIG